MLDAGVAGLDLRALLEDSLQQRRATTPSGAVADVQSGADRFQIFLDQFDTSDPNDDTRNP